MNLSFGKKTSEAVGLDVDGGFLAAAVVDEGSIGRLASAELAPGVTADGEVKDPAALSAALKDLFRTHKLPERVRLGVANQQIVVRQLEIPMIENAARARRRRPLHGGRGDRHAARRGGAGLPADRGVRGAGRRSSASGSWSSPPARP